MRAAPLGKLFIPAMAYRVAMGWLLGYIFFSYYQQGDTINYFTDARQLAQLAYQYPTNYVKILTGQLPPPTTLMYAEQPRALFFAKIVSIVNIFTFNNYWIASVYFSLISFWASWWLANYLSFRFPQHHYAAAVAFLFYPSVAFWSAGILKESIAVAAIVLIVYLFLRLQAADYSKVTLGPIVLSLVLAIWMLWKVKYYYAGVLLPTLLSAIVAQAVSRQKRRRVMLPVFTISWLALVGLASLLHPRLALGELAEVLVYNHDVIVRASDPSNIIHFQSLDKNPGSFVENMLLAVVSALFRPLAGEGTTFLQWMASLENTVLLLLLVGALINVRRIKFNSADSLWLVATLTYIVVLGSLLAFASPNFGSLVRYKVAFLPFLVFLCLAGNQWLTSLKKLS